MPSSILLAKHFFRDHYSANYYGQIMANHSKLPYCIALLQIPHAKTSNLMTTVFFVTVHGRTPKQPRGIYL